MLCSWDIRNKTQAHQQPIAEALDGNQKPGSFGSHSCACPNKARSFGDRLHCIGHSFCASSATWSETQAAPLGAALHHPMGRAGGQIFLTRERCHFSRGKLGERDSATQWYVRGCPKHIRQVPTRRTPGAHIWTRDWRVRQRDPSRVMHKSQPARGPLKPHRHYSHCRLAALARSDSFPLGGSHLPPASSTFCQQIPVVPAGAPAKVHTRAGPSRPKQHVTSSSQHGRARKRGRAGGRTMPPAACEGPQVIRAGS